MAVTAMGAVGVNVCVTARDNRHALAQTLSQVNLSDQDVYGLGDGADQFNQKWSATFTIHPLAPVDIDLKALVDDMGNAVDLKTVRILLVMVGATGNGLRVQPGSVDAWTYFLNASAGSSLILPPGTTMLISCPVGQAWTVDATHRMIRLASSAGATDAIVTVLVAGCAS